MKGILLGTASSVLLGGCATLNPPSLNYDMSTATVPVPGTITLSAPKLYSRELLIEERRRDTDWLNVLMTESTDRTKVVFGPEIARELEFVTAFSAALGLSFDPAAGLSYRQDRETNAIQQEIDVLKLQLQLDKLQRDAELLRASFPAQESPANEGLGTLGEASEGAASGGSAPATGQLNAAIGNLITQMTAAMAAEGKLPARAGTATSPFDDFRDRAAYRDLIKSALNSAALDELHDLGGANLIRLNFQSTLFPHPDNLRSLGAIEIEVLQSDDDDRMERHMDRFVEDWLRSLNEVADARSGGSFTAASMQARLEQLGYVATYRIGTTEFLMPNDPAYLFALDGIVGIDGADLVTSVGTARNGFSGVPAIQAVTALEAICAGTGPDAGTLRLMLQLRNTVLSHRSLHEMLMDYWATTEPRLGAYRSNYLAVDQFAQSMRQVLSVHDAERKSNCWALLAEEPAQAQLPGAMRQRVGQALGIDGSEAIRFYEIGPRQQVQQVSTVARNASSLALAASIAASMPSAGASASAAAAYSRRAVSNAAAIERVPAVVGFMAPAEAGARADRGQGSFGWVFGPRAVLDARGRVRLQQVLATYDLSVDLSVPGWWSELRLKVRSQWAPNPAALVRGGNAATDGGSRTVVVPLPRDGAIFSDLTEALLYGRGGRPVIQRVYGGPITACTTSTVVVEGSGLWRARNVMVLGRMIEARDIRVLPNMLGISFTVPKVEPTTSLRTQVRPVIRVMTPSGEVETIRPEDFPRDPSAFGLVYEPDPTGKACSEAEKPVDPTAPAISHVDDRLPLKRHVPARLSFIAYGANLAKVSSVTLGGIAGKLTAADDGKSATAVFERDVSEGIPAGREVRLVFLNGQTAVATHAVEITR